jgi:hypothetical protein
MERPDFGGRPPNRSEGSKSTMSSIEEERLSSRSDGIRPAAAGRLLVCPPAEDPVCDAVPCIGACSAAASRDFRRLRAKLLRNHRFTSDGICPSSSSKRFVAQQSRRTAFAATHCSWGHTAGVPCCYYQWCSWDLNGLRRFVPSRCPALQRCLSIPPRA